MTATPKAASGPILLPRPAPVHFAKGMAWYGTPLQTASSADPHRGVEDARPVPAIVVAE